MQWYCVQPQGPCNSAPRQNFKSPLNILLHLNLESVCQISALKLHNCASRQTGQHSLHLYVQNISAIKNLTPLLLLSRRINIFFSKYGIGEAFDIIWIHISLLSYFSLYKTDCLFYVPLSCANCRTNLHQILHRPPHQLRECS